MPTNAEIKTLIDIRVRAQDSHILNDGVAEILDFIVDNIAAGGGSGSIAGIDDVLAEAQALTANRSIDINGKIFSITEGGEDLLLIDADGAEKETKLKSVHPEGGGNSGFFGVGTTASSATFSFEANFNNNTKVALIAANTDALMSSLEYQAETHTFTGAVILPTSDPGVSGAIWNNAGVPAISA